MSSVYDCLRHAQHIIGPELTLTFMCVFRLTLRVNSSTLGPWLDGTSPWMGAESFHREASPAALLIARARPWASSTSVSHVELISRAELQAHPDLMNGACILVGPPFYRGVLYVLLFSLLSARCL